MNSSSAALRSVLAKRIRAAGEVAVGHVARKLDR
jgi:hypothetical protein